MKNIITIEKNHYIEFDLEPNVLDTIKSIDTEFKNIAFKNRLEWFSSDIPFEVLEAFYKSIISDNKLKVQIHDEDLQSIYDINNNTIEYNSIKDNTKLDVVFQLMGLTFLKQQFYCDIQIKQINEISDVFLVNYDSNEELDSDTDEHNNNILDLENSEIVDLSENIINLDDNTVNIDENINLNDNTAIDIDEKIKIMNEVKDELDLLRQSVK